MSRICILYTGGTIGMVRTDNGYAPKAGYLEEEMGHLRDLHRPEMPEWDLFEFDPLLDSSNIAYPEWNQMARAIEANYDKYDGFVVLHGTDTMSYSASALSFMLDGLAKPVVFTGAQIPLCEPRSDGKDNLITALLIASQGIANEVSLYFGNRLLRGTRSTKQSADGLIAFASPDYPDLARAGIHIDYRVRSLNANATSTVDLAALRKAAGFGTAGGADAEGSEPETPANGLTVTEIKKSRIGVIKLFPGIQFDLFEPIMTDRLDGLVLETFGAGNIPGYDASLLPLITRAIENGTIVVVCTQCPQGTVTLGTYETGSALLRAGAVSGYNMTTEATVTKLAYLYSLGLPRAEIRRLMEQNLRGELTR